MVERVFSTFYKYMDGLIFGKQVLEKNDSQHLKFVNDTGYQFFS